MGLVISNHFDVICDGLLRYSVISNQFDVLCDGLLRYSKQSVIWNTFNYLLVPSASLLNKFAYNYNDLVFPPLYHSNIQLAFDPTMGWLSILITSWTSLDAPGTMSPVLNETATSFRCIVIKDMEKLWIRDINYSD